MMSRIQTTHVASTTTFSPLVNENTAARVTGTTNPITRAPRLSFGYSSANRLARSSITSR